MVQLKQIFIFEHVLTDTAHGLHYNLSCNMLQKIKLINKNRGRRKTGRADVLKLHAPCQYMQTLQQFSHTFSLINHKYNGIL